jgi:hypothetical protein
MIHDVEGYHNIIPYIMNSDVIVMLKIGDMRGMFPSPVIFLEQCIMHYTELITIIMMSSYMMHDDKFIIY